MGQKQKKKGFVRSVCNMNVIIVDGKLHIPFHFLLVKETEIRQDSGPLNFLKIN